MSDKKTAIITGASGGIGGDLVEAFFKLGYHVVGTSRNGVGHFRSLDVRVLYVQCAGFLARAGE